MGRVRGRVTAASYFAGFQMTKTAQPLKLAFFLLYPVLNLFRK